MDLSKKYNLQALNEYNFENINFDISFGEVSEKELERLKQEEKEEMERIKKESQAFNKK